MSTPHTYTSGTVRSHPSVVHDLCTPTFNITRGSAIYYHSSLPMSPKACSARRLRACPPLPSRPLNAYAAFGVALTRDTTGIAISNTGRHHPCRWTFKAGQRTSPWRHAHAFKPLQSPTPPSPSLWAYARSICH